MGPTAKRWIVIVIGLILIGIGLLIGLASHQVIYQSVSSEMIANYIVGQDGVSYMKMDGSSTLYIVREHDFTPTFDANALGNGLISFVYQPDDMTNIDVTSENGTHLAGEAYGIVEITVPGASQTAYVTANYAQHPQGYYVSYWNIGSPFIGIGAAIIVLSLFIANRIFTVIYCMFGGAFVVPIGFFLFVGFEIGFDLPSLKQAFFDDLMLAVLLAAIGGAIGLIVGLVQAVRRKDMDN